MSKKEVTSANWSSTEIKLLNTVDIFLQKPAIMKKAEANLSALKIEIIKKLSHGSPPCPSAADISKGQIARGENHNGFPFISLDMPQMFSKNKMFTYRTLFWWGHYLAFSLIVREENQDSLIEKLVHLKEYPEWKDIHLAIAPTPWEWTKNKNNFLLLSEVSESKIRNIISSIQYIKLCRFFELSSPEFKNLNWIDNGLAAWETLSKIYTD